MLLRPVSSTNSAWRPHVKGLIFAALATAALAALAAFLLARAISRPVRRVAEATRGLARATEQPPLVPVAGPRELALLAESFNELAVELAKAREAERAFLLSVSHELKTPLTAIRGYAEGLHEGVLPTDEAAATIANESRRLERLVGDLLDLARMRKAEFSVRREHVDLGAVATEAVRRYESQARAFGVTLEAESAAEAHALADSDRTLQVVSNLVENALRLTPAGGSVRIVVGAGRDQGRGHRPGARAGRARARLRALLPLLPLRPRAPGRHRPRARDREGARAGHGRLGPGDELAGPSDGLHRTASRAPACRDRSRTRDRFYARFTFGERAPDRWRKGCDCQLRSRRNR